jgi:hypothetical protein
LLGQFVKISAYADDTAVHLGALADIKIYCLLLRQYSLGSLKERPASIDR